jgi:lactate permease
MQLFSSLFPLLLLVFLMTFRKGVPSYIALPFVAFLTYLLQLFYFHQTAADVHATVLAGFLTTFTPILILWGAVFLFKTMEECGSLDLIRRSLNRVSTHPIAQLMIVGWAFSFFIEGISGFGTPAALAAPLLVGFGFNAFPVVLFCLALNTIPVTFGAVGTPIWFGFSELALSKELLAQVAIKTATIQFFCALVIPIFALRFVLPWHTIRKNLLFIYASILLTVIPYFIFSFFNTEFPSIFGGLSGLLLTVFLAQRKIGLHFDDEEKKSVETVSGSMNLAESFKAFFPLAASVFILLITRIQGLGLKSWLTQGASWMQFDLKGFGNFYVSSSLVLKWENILGTAVNWKHPLLYVPSLLPFGLVCLICFVLFRLEFKKITLVWNETLQRLVTPFLALMGAMIFVKLFMLGGESSPVILIGSKIADLSGGAWRWTSVYLGALGSFFAGSATVSNLTFGAIQVATAQRLAVDLPTVLALQDTGGAMGNMACIHNIVAVCAVLGLKKHEGQILKKIFPLLLLYGAIAGSVALFL